MINKNKLINRFKSVIVDQVSITLVAMFSSMPMLIYKGVSADPSDEPKFLSSLIIAFIWTLLFNKDIYFGRSLGKYWSSLQVVNIKTGRHANPIQCLVRNIFLLLWPIEMIILVFSPSRRLGDIIANTKVVVFDADIEKTEPQQSILRIVSILIPFIAVYFLSFNFF
jgi:uncharacterized RDD family membrane protein YckC